MLSAFISLPADNNTDNSGPKEVLFMGSPWGGFAPPGAGQRLARRANCVQQTEWAAEIYLLLLLLLSLVLLLLLILLVLLLPLAIIPPVDGSGFRVWG